jgi:hypothetical protein
VGVVRLCGHRGTSMLQANTPFAIRCNSGAAVTLVEGLLIDPSTRVSR